MKQVGFRPKLKMSAVGAMAAMLGLFGSTATSAHHSFAMFDVNRLWRWEGEVVAFDWRNPHMHIIVAVSANSKEAAAAGVDTTGRWDFEGESVAQATRQGWNRNSLAVGDKIVLVGHPLKSSVKGGAGVFLVKANAEPLYFSNNRDVTPKTSLKWK